MRNLAFALAAATALGIAVPASAQGLYVGAGDGGFGVGVTNYGPYGPEDGWAPGGPYRSYYPVERGGSVSGYAYAGSPRYSYAEPYAYGYAYPGGWDGW